MQGHMNGHLHERGNLLSPNGEPRLVLFDKVGSRERKVVRQEIVPVIGRKAICGNSGGRDGGRMGAFESCAGFA